MLHQPPTPTTRTFSFFLLLLAIFATLIWAKVTHWQPAILATDLKQERLDIALPVPRGNGENRQTFLPAHNGLTEIELLLVRYGGPSPDDTGSFSVTLLDETERIVTEQSWENVGINHNQTVRLQFPPQPNSADQRYTLVFAGNATNQVTNWGYHLPLLGKGQLTLAEPTDNPPQTLRFSTRYQLLWGDALQYLGETFSQNGLFLFVAILFMLLPGALLMPAFPHQWHTTQKWGIALPAGISFWAILWHWSSLIGWHWRDWSLWLLFLIGWLTVIIRFLIQNPLSQISYPKLDKSTLILPVLLIILALRLLAIRDLAFPPWVDSSRHALNSAIMRDTGQIVTNYAPYLPVDRAPYHFGFHTLSASLSMMMAVGLPRLLLILGQLLNALIPLTIYVGATLLTQRRLIGWLAAFLVGFPFYFPAYYATWGRFTQLTAMLILPALIALTWLLLTEPDKQKKLHWLVGLLTAGIFLTHFRVFLLYLPFAGIAWIVTSLLKRIYPSANGWQATKQLLIAGIIGTILITPRAIQLLQQNEGYTYTNAPKSYNTFPTGYLNIGWERPFLYLGGVAILVATLFALRRKKWGWLLLTLAGWVGIAGNALSDKIPFIPPNWLINLNSAYITLFLPLSWGLAILFSKIWDLHHQQTRFLKPLFTLIAGILLTLATLFGIRQQINIINETTILALPADFSALTWSARNLPANANVAINSWQWLGTTWAGGDGGAWLNPLLQRQTSTPPVDYIYSRELANRVTTFNQTAQATPDWRDPESVKWLTEQGITHIFVGKKGGFFDPYALHQNPKASQLYAQDGVFIFQLLE